MKILKSRFFISIVLIVAILAVRHIYCGTKSYVMPRQSKENINFIVNKESKSKNDYRKLFEQTGLSPAAINELIELGKEEIIYNLQTMIYTKPDFEKVSICYPFTAMERNRTQITPLAPLKDGDILVTFNTLTCDWRHGHCAIVTDAKNGTVLEHMAIGSTSCFTDAKAWGKYPAFAVLRYPDEKKAQMAAEYAEKYLIDIDYNIFAGVIKKDKSDEIRPECSHCSHIVWQAYKAAGADIDRDKGFVVTPENIAASEKLKVIQIFGIDYDKYQDRLAK